MFHISFFDLIEILKEEEFWKNLENYYENFDYNDKNYVYLEITINLKLDNKDNKVKEYWFIKSRELEFINIFIDYINNEKLDKNIQFNIYNSINTIKIIKDYNTIDSDKHNNTIKSIYFKTLLVYLLDILNDYKILGFRKEKFDLNNLLMNELINHFKDVVQDLPNIYRKYMACYKISSWWKHILQKRIK